MLKLSGQDGIVLFAVHCVSYENTFFRIKPSLHPLISGLNIYAQYAYMLLNLRYLHGKYRNN